MIKLKVDELLAKKGKSRYWLCKKLSITWPNGVRLIENETRSIRYDIIEKLCEIFECEPTDLFELRK